MTPIVSDDIVYCSAGYGVGAGACKIARSGDSFTATQLWFEPANVLNNHWSTPVCQEGYLYGLFGFKEYGKAPLKCVEVATGKTIWTKEGFGPGGCTLVDGHVLVLSDAGDLVLVKATPEAYTEVARTHAVAGKCWSSPCVSNGHIYARECPRKGFAWMFPRAKWLANNSRNSAQIYVNGQITVGEFKGAIFCGLIEAAGNNPAVHLDAKPVW